MTTKQNQYRVTEASFYTVDSVPVLAEYRFQMVEEIKPQPGKFRKFCEGVGTVLLWVFWIFFTLVILIAIFGH